MKYEYLLHTWGGFYNDQYSKIHKKKDGFIYFDTKIERDTYVKELEVIEQRLNARHLVIKLSEGYNTRTIIMLHRVIKFDGKEYYSEYKLSPNYEFDVAKYHLENKWYPGFNDYPLGEDFDYEKVKTVQEWITGAFDITDN